METTLPSGRRVPLLRAALLVDAAASAVTGVVMAAGATVLPPWLGIGHNFLLAVGLAFLPYAAGVACLGMARQAPSFMVAGVIAGNIVWAVACTLLATGIWGEATMLGKGFAALQAIAVLVFAGAQFLGLRFRPAASPA